MELDTGVAYSVITQIMYQKIEGGALPGITRPQIEVLQWPADKSSTTAASGGGQLW